MCKKRTVISIELLIVNIIHLMNVIMQSVYKAGERVHLVTYTNDFRQYLIGVREYIFTHKVLPAVAYQGRIFAGEKKNIWLK